MGLKVFAEGELFGESEAVGHFLDGHAGLYEEVLGLVDGEELSRHRRGVEEGDCYCTFFNIHRRKKGSSISYCGARTT